jgi:hypothetical protein
MSKVSIKGNTSGTGTFTIEAPASNSNRTLSLPDTSGEMYNQGNIVGTVSESGGVPTGAIIERGSNANGEYVMFADGTMICTFLATNASHSTTHRRLSGVATFPVAFVSSPSASCNLLNNSTNNAFVSPNTTTAVLPSGVVGPIVRDTSTTGVATIFYAISGLTNFSNGDSLIGSGMAFGRWY